MTSGGLYLRKWCFRLGVDPRLRKGGMLMTTVTRRDNESIEDALKRFKRELRKVGVLREAKKHEHYEKPSEIKKRKKAEMARNKGRRADY